MATLEQLQTWLGEAETARHSFAMGESVVEVWRDGRRVAYSARNMKDLDGYITWLTNKIAQTEADATGKPRRSALTLAWRD